MYDKFSQLSSGEKEYIREKLSNLSYGEKANREQLLSVKFGVSTRTLRRWKSILGVTEKPIEVSQRKVLIYDIETSRAEAKVFWTGKQFVSYKQIKKEPKIISISYKWLGEDEIYSLTWDQDQCDRKMVETFLEVYNSADMVIGYNNDNFDNRWLNAQAIKYNLDVNVFVKSLDLYKQEKRLARFLSYSMDYSARALGVEFKQSHEGIVMWDMIEDGTPEQQKEYLQKMVDYNVGDIVTTEELYFRLMKYLAPKTHIGVLNGNAKFSCPSCGGYNVEPVRIMTTPAGTQQVVMRCKDDGTQYKVNMKQFSNFKVWSGND
jgi:uncharacterized protein YprB with RNaseH-like and TPR domain